MIAASSRGALVWSITPGQVGDSPEGRKLVEALGPQDTLVYLLMDSAYEGDDMRAIALLRNLQPVVPPPRTQGAPPLAVR